MVSGQPTGWLLLKCTSMIGAPGPVWLQGLPFDAATKVTRQHRQPGGNRESLSMLQVLHCTDMQPPTYKVCILRFLCGLVYNGAIVARLPQAPTERARWPFPGASDLLAPGTISDKGSQRSIGDIPARRTGPMGSSLSHVLHVISRAGESSRTGEAIRRAG